MATHKALYGKSVVIISLIIAMLLMIIPVPDTLRFVRPEWVLLALIYWAMALPHQSGVGMAWTVGLLMDVLMGGVLGVLACAYSLVIYLVLHFYLQLRQYPVWQQALSIMPLVLVAQIVVVVMTLGSRGSWLPAVSSMVLWPVVYLMLRAVRRTFHVS